MAIAAITVGVVAAIAYARKAEKQRTESIEETAARLGWGFRADVPFKSLPDLTRFELFRQGSSRSVRNVLTSPPGNPRAVIFDYSYTISTGKSTQTVRQTVFYATAEDLDLPSFSLRPENFFHRVGGLFGYQDIDIDHRPEFSSMFLLRGSDEAAVRAAFTDAVIDFFEQRRGVCAAAISHELLVWWPGRVRSAEELDQLVGDGFEIASLFADAYRET